MNWDRRAKDPGRRRYVVNHACSNARLTEDADSHATSHHAMLMEHVAGVMNRYVWETTV